MPVAQAFAHQLHGELLLVEAVQLPDLAQEVAAMVPMDVTGDLEALSAEATAYLEGIAELLRADAPSVDTDRRCWAAFGLDSGRGTARGAGLVGHGYARSGGLIQDRPRQCHISCAARWPHAGRRCPATGEPSKHRHPPRRRQHR